VRTTTAGKDSKRLRSTRVQRSQLANLKLREIARIVIETGQDPEQISAR
jgi:hypothetical protein